MQFEENIIHRPAPKALKYDGEKSLGHLILKQLVNAGDNTVIVCGLTGTTLSAAQLLEKSIEIAKALQSSGIEEGDVVSIMSETRFEFVFVLLGSIFMNCAFAPLNHTYNEREVEHAVNLFKPKFIFASGATSRIIMKATRKLCCVKKFIFFDECGDSDRPIIDSSAVISLKDFVNQIVSKDLHFEPKAVNISTSNCLILCSSGTTGFPKAVKLSQRGIFASLNDFDSFILTKQNVGDDPITILGLLPMFHVLGIAVLIVSLATPSSKLIMLPRFEEKTFLGCVEKYGCSVTFLVPPLFVFLSKHPYVDKYNLSSLRLLFVGAAPLSKELEQSVIDRLRNPKLKIRQGYAMTELTSALMQKEILKAGSVGDVNLNVYAKVIDENNRACGPNIVGELCFKGNGTMMGYVDDEIATKALIDEDGWLHTGDVGYYDTDLQFFIVDRIKELIKYKAFQKLKLYC
ncbi:luciferin 4-monooxygenase-like isoform X2 [Bradysia coprophila]|uniref:luciferin 4-monooxygenase-like isoform X2 n=1 Tax=Bradysia coprophila TaxID=38358 RepID=UPI00187DD2C1|nr:luciferin 4-monooxygenase-like isoform X2 [Bradysia coprophila]